MNKIKQEEQKRIDKLEQEKLEEIIVYTIDFGGYQKISTSDKEVAYKIWEAISGSFFELKEAGPSNRYSPPCFYYKHPMEIKLSAEKKKVWKDQESAIRAANAFAALTEQANKKKEEPEF